MRIGKFEVPWSDIGKVAAGVATVVASFFLFLYAHNALRLGVLALLVVIFFLYRHVSSKKKMSPRFEKDLKGEDERKKYG